MDQTREEQVAELKQLRVPELQKLFLEVVGEPTRAPNKTFLVRRILAALEEKGKAAQKVEPKSPPKKKAKDGLSTLSVEELQKKYTEVLGRPTGSSDRRYLIWKIKAAKAGKVRVGPARERTRSDADYKVLPVRLEADVVETMDAAWRRQGMKTRMDLFRQALHDYLRGVGETEAADAVLPAAE